MSTRTNVKAKTRARYLLATMVALVFALALAAPSAFADDPVMGKITINTNTEGGAQPSDLKYEGYQIFTADVDKAGNATNFAWANDQVKAAVLAAIVENEPESAPDTPATTVTIDGKTLTIANLTAQDAASYIRAKFPSGSTYTTMVEDDSFAMALAKKIQASSAAKTEITPGGTGTSFREGYVLVLTKNSTLNGGEATDGSATSPIFALINGKDENIEGDEAVDVNITEKTKVPTIKKEVQEDRAEVYVAKNDADPAYYELKDGTFTTTAYADAEDDAKANYVDTSDSPQKFAKKADRWGTVADAMIGQDVEYRLTGTLPNNLVSYDTYYYKFEDTMTNIALKGGDTSSVVVKIDNNVVASGVEVSYANNKLEVTFADILKAQTAEMKAAADANASNVDYDPQYISVTADSVVTVTYEAHLTSDAVIGAENGNPNVVKIEYSKNPTNTEHGTTEKKENKLFTYKLDITKVDKNQEATTLDGVKFLLWNEAKNQVAEISNGKFVAWHDATHTDSNIESDYNEAYKIATANGGKLEIAGLDEGTYYLQETNSLSGYDKIPEVKFQIISKLADDPENSTTIRATMSGGNGDGEDTNNDGYVDKGTGLTSVTNDTGVVAGKVTNEKKITMPLTGMDGITFTYILGGIILAVSVFALLRRKMSNRVQEDVA